MPKNQTDGIEFTLMLESAIRATQLEYRIYNFGVFQQAKKKVGAFCLVNLEIWINWP